jgi:GNAT superfamily N-acetyltransferase
MLVRKFDRTTDRLGALAVLQAGIREQRLAARRSQPGHQEYRRIDLGAAYDETTDSFVAPETWYVAVDGQQVVGVLQIMSEADPRERLYKRHRLLLIQELDARPKRRGAGTALLEEAKREALRRGRTALVLQTPTGGDAHTAWYPARGFRPWPEGDHRQMSGMILQLGIEGGSPERLNQ